MLKETQNHAPFHHEARLQMRRLVSTHKKDKKKKKPGKAHSTAAPPVVTAAEEGRTVASHDRNVSFADAIEDKRGMTSRAEWLLTFHYSAHVAGLR